MLSRGLLALKHTAAEVQLRFNFSVLESAARIMARNQFPHLTGAATINCFRAWKMYWIRQKQHKEGELQNDRIVLRLRNRMTWMTKYGYSASTCFVSISCFDFLFRFPSDSRML